MNEQLPNPAINPAQLQEVIMPQSFEPGVYVSSAPLPTEQQEIVVIEAYNKAYKSEQIPRAIGMAALPEDYKDQQMTSLVYNGMTSEQYDARHIAFLANWAASEQFNRQVLQNLENDSSDDETDDETDSDYARARKDEKANRRVSR